MDTTARLAAAVADAADAWLKDPLDSNVYRLLVEATVRWREHRQPALPWVEQPQLGEDDPQDTGPLPTTLGESMRELADRLRPDAERLPEPPVLPVEEPR